MKLRLTTLSASLVLLASAHVFAAPAEYDNNDRGQSISDEVFLKAAKDSFYLNNPAEFERFKDATLEVCNKTIDKPNAEQTKDILAREQKSIIYPKDKKLMGDWKKGQQWSELAHGGRIGYPGFIDADDPHHPNGANCYACHAIDPNFPQAGNTGPALTNYGARGTSEAMVKYTYDKVFNSKSMNPCSLMPRYGGEPGSIRLLTPEQVADIVAFLLSPDSPVNKPKLAAAK